MALAQLASAFDDGFLDYLQDHEQPKPDRSPDRRSYRFRHQSGARRSGKPAPIDSEAAHSATDHACNQRTRKGSLLNQPIGDKTNRQADTRP
jgi:hypothetical protein